MIRKLLLLMLMMSVSTFAIARSAMMFKITLWQTGQAIDVTNRAALVDETTYSTKPKNEFKQSIMVLEGKRGEIHLSQEFPITIFGGDGLETTNMKTVRSFYVMPHLYGKTVVLNVGFLNEAKSQINEGGKESSAMSTTLRVPVNQWYLLGDPDPAIESDKKEIDYETDKTDQKTAVYIKAELLNR